MTGVQTCALPISVRLLAEDWTGTEPPLAAPEATLLDPAGRARWAETLEEDVLKAGLAAIASVSEERVAHDGGGANADALFNGTTRNGAGDDTTTDDGKTFRGYGSGSTLTVRLTQPHDLTAVRTFAAHPDGRASQGYTLWVATAADPGRFDKVETASAACAGGASELRLRVDAKGVVALRFEFTDGPLGFNVYREIQIVGQPALAKEPK